MKEEARIWLVDDRSNDSGGPIERHKIYRASNGYGASVIKGWGTYGGDKGLWELAVIEFMGSSDDYGLIYDTPVTNDVLGYLTLEEVDKILLQIAELPPRKGK